MIFRSLCLEKIDFYIGINAIVPTYICVSYMTYYISTEASGSVVLSYSITRKYRTDAQLPMPNYSAESTSYNV
jgi:hypothetical protein